MSRPSTPAERTARIQELEELPALLEHAVASLGDAQLDTPYRPGGWTVRQVVHHIADSHLNAFARMKFAMTEQHPTIKPYDQDAWAVLADYALPPGPSIALLRGLHERMAALLRGVHDEAVWQRTIDHPENGTMSLDDLLRSYAHHGRHHVEQITALRRARNW